MAAKHIVFFCLVTVALGLPNDCDVSEEQGFDIRVCTKETQTVAKVEGRCPQDIVRQHPVCKEVETEFCFTSWDGSERCRTFPFMHCEHSYEVTTRMFPTRDDDDTCEADKATCSDTTVQGPKTQKCSF